MANIIFRAPTTFSISTVRFFLKEVEKVFRWNNKEIKDFVLELGWTTEIDILGQLLLYKFLEYSVKHQCFYFPKINVHNKVTEELRRSTFWSLINDFIRNQDVNYKELKFREYKGIFIVPINLTTKTKDEAEALYAPRITTYYSDKHVQFVVLSCMGEVASNFHEHSNDKTNAILVASGNNTCFKIACADTGVGIISSLRPSLGLEYKRKDGFEILQKSVEREVTSKHNTNHTGCGLWLIDSFVTGLKGELHIYSEGAYYINHQGKIKKGRCSYWKGTIIYVYLPFNSQNALPKMRKLMEEGLEEI